MKATLEFNLPEGESEFRSALNGGKWKAAMHGLDEYLRKIEKYGEGNISAKEARQNLHEIAESYGLALYED